MLYDNNHYRKGLKATTKRSSIRNWLIMKHPANKYSEVVKQIRNIISAMQIL